jgi:poly-gamma-glutamate synthesis protein (capsule biosynthesis protein)
MGAGLVFCLFTLACSGVVPKKTSEGASSSEAKPKPSTPIVLEVSKLAQPDVPAVKEPEFVGEILPISTDLAAKMKGVTWHEGCPVPLEELRHLRVSAVNTQGETYVGELVVHEEAAYNLVLIFRRLFEARFPVHSMRLIHEFGGSDDRSVDANNSSAFNCRSVTGRSGRWSKHALGRAIDINPLWNPYVKGRAVLPESGRDFVDRSRAHPGMIKVEGMVYQQFTRYGWIWGGAWRRMKDYQHFEYPVSP